MKSKGIAVFVAGAAVSSSGMAFAGCGACGSDYGHSHADKTTAELTSYGAGRDIVSVAKQAGSFNTLLAAAKAAGLAGTLGEGGPFTVFAPTDEAFANLPTGTVEKLLLPENKGLLQAVLTYHVVPGRVPASQVVSLQTADTVNGQRVDIRTKGDVVMVDGAKVVKTDVAASNGVIHVIDRVIMPVTDNIVETAQAAGSFGTLLAAAKAAGLVPALSGEGPITVLAPTDEAFAKLGQSTINDLLKPANRDKLAGILKLHVLEGRVYADKAVSAGRAATLNGQSVSIGIQDGRVRIGEAGVVMSDIETSNGVIHAIDTVLLP